MRISAIVVVCQAYTMLVLVCVHLITLFCDLPSCRGTDSLQCQGLVFLARFFYVQC